MGVEADYGGVRLGTGDTTAERLELAAVLGSPLFARAQRLVKLLEYIAEKHFAGQEAEVCEYSIATEVLGRPAGFDPAEDAIARVEIHRLRKKLREYYSDEGAHRALQIMIPPGMYTPVFQPHGAVAAPPPTNGKGLALPAAESPPDVKLEERAEPPLLVPALVPARVAVAPGPPRKRKFWVLAAAGVVLIAATAGTMATLRTTELPQPVPPPHFVPPAVAGVDSGVRIMAGYNRKYVDHQGHSWMPDAYFEGGSLPAAPFRRFISRTSDPLMYQNGRIGVTAYNIPLKPGNYEMKLHFVEPVYGPGLETGGGENSRVFDVLVNGEVILDSFDIVSDAGGTLVADVRTFKDIHPGPDGILKLGFHAKRELPIISAIEIEPAQPHRMNPIRIVTQANSVSDSRGQIWEADNYYSGGQVSNHWKSVLGTPDPDLFGHERYGHFSYAIPVAPGSSYSVTIYLAETYWGKENQGGPGQRTFDVFCNGLSLLRNLDILKEAGPNHALLRRFHGLRPNPQGKLNLEFIPILNYASLFAIEVLDEGR